MRRASPYLVGLRSCFALPKIELEAALLSPCPQLRKVFCEPRQDLVLPSVRVGNDLHVIVDVLQNALLALPYPLDLRLADVGLAKFTQLRFAKVGQAVKGALANPLYGVRTQGVGLGHVHHRIGVEAGGMVDEYGLIAAIDPMLAAHKIKGMTVKVMQEHVENAGVSAKELFILPIKAAF